MFAMSSLPCDREGDAKAAEPLASVTGGSEEAAAATLNVCNPYVNKDALTGAAPIAESAGLASEAATETEAGGGCGGEGTNAVCCCVPIRRPITWR